MEYLLDQVSNSQSMVILSDHKGILMHTMGELNFLSKAERVALMCGASWNESQRGTNAIGIALAEFNEVEIYGAGADRKRQTIRVWLKEILGTQALECTDPRSQVLCS